MRRVRFDNRTLCAYLLEAVVTGASKGRTDLYYSQKDCGRVSLVSRVGLDSCSRIYVGAVDAMSVSTLSLQPL